MSTHKQPVPDLIDAVAPLLLYSKLSVSVSSTGWIDAASPAQQVNNLRVNE
jgi:hypothetical protein